MDTPETIQTIRRRVAAKISRMTKEKAIETLAAIAKRGSTIIVPEIADLTGGYNSQNINFAVQRKLGVKAGYMRNAK